MMYLESLDERGFIVNVGGNNLDASRSKLFAFVTAWVPSDGANFPARSLGENIDHTPTLLASGSQNGNGLRHFGFVEKYITIKRAIEVSGSELPVQRCCG